MLGQTISHYKILAKLGGGGMGVVYKAEDTKLKRFVALKFLPFDLTRDDDAKERFVHEAQTASALDHPNICTIYEIDETQEGQMFIAMAYYDGETLKKRMAKGEERRAESEERRVRGEERDAPLAPRSSPLAMTDGLPVVDAIDIAAQIAQGLSRAHEAGITHRDIKPANVMITNRGEVKIVDFGLAKLAGRTKITKSGTTMGTAAYMSPEQAQGAETDHRTDIWSLGVVIYEMLTGQLPFSGEYEMAMMYSLVSTDPQPVRSLRSEVSVGLEQIVNKALAKKPDERYQQVDELLADLKQPTEKIESKKTFPTRKLAVARRWYLYAGLVVLILGVVLAGIFLRPNPAEAIDSIAVLPLENMTGDPNQEYFVDGMTEALIANLAKISSLRVISRTSIMQYKKARKSLPEIARELNVAAIVEGSVSRSNGRVRITAQLIDAPKDRHLWANSYDRDLRDVLALQSEVTTAIVREIQVKLTPQEQTQLTKTRTITPEAYDAYLKGRYFLNKWTEDDSKKALKYFQEAIELDPTYAQAHAGLADYYTQSSFWGFIFPKDSYPKAKASAAKALELDETIAEAHNTLAQIKQIFDWDLIGAEPEYKRALALNPNSADAHAWYGSYLVDCGRFEEAIAEIKRAIELDPLNITWNLSLGWVYFNARRYDESIVQLKKTLELDPQLAYAHMELGWNYAFKGMYAEAVAASDKAVSLSSPDDEVTLGAIGYVYAVSSKPDKAKKILKQLLELSTRSYVDAYYITLIYAGLGEKDRAFEWLNKAYDERSPSMSFLKIEPMFDSLRNDPRYTELLRKVGLEK